MNVELKPEDERLIQKRLEHGGFASAEEVIHHALQAQDAEEAWLDLHKREVGERIERAIAEFDQGGGIPASQVRRRLREMKAADR
jgi:antitoxin ParD1/3/4